jgi:hypothetical protein
MSPACRRDLLLRPSRSASRPPQHVANYTWQFLPRRPSCGPAWILQHGAGGERPHTQALHPTRVQPLVKFPVGQRSGNIAVSRGVHWGGYCRALDMRCSKDNNIGGISRRGNGTALPHTLGRQARYQPCRSREQMQTPRVRLPSGQCQSTLAAASTRHSKSSAQLGPRALISDAD